MGFMKIIPEEVSESFVVLKKYGKQESYKRRVHTDFILVMKNECDDVVSLKVTPTAFYKAAKDKIMYFSLTKDDVLCYNYPWYINNPWLSVSLLTLVVISGFAIMVTIVFRFTE